MCILKQYLLVCSELEDLGAMGLFVLVYMILTLHMHWKSVLLKTQQVQEMCGACAAMGQRKGPMKQSHLERSAG